MTEFEKEPVPVGYYDAETPEKCAQVSQLHQEFYMDLQQRHMKASEDFQVYHSRLQELVSQQQVKVAHHSSKLNVVWSPVIKA